MIKRHSKKYVILLLKRIKGQPDKNILFTEGISLKWIHKFIRL